MIVEACCLQCGFAGEISKFPIINEAYTCPECKTDESGIELIRNDDQKTCPDCGCTLYMDADSQEYKHRFTSCAARW